MLRCGVKRRIAMQGHDITLHRGRGHRQHYTVPLPEKMSCYRKWPEPAPKPFLKTAFAKPPDTWLTQEECSQYQIMTISGHMQDATSEACTKRCRALAPGPHHHGRNDGYGWAMYSADGSSMGHMTP